MHRKSRSIRFLPPVAGESSPILPQPENDIGDQLAVIQEQPSAHKEAGHS